MFGGSKDHTARRDVLLLTIGSLLCLLPFVGKAVHLDDPVYVWIAQQIHIDPTDFFGFEINWHGHRVSIPEFNRNPPGVSYLLAAAAWIGGWSETVLHLGILPFSLAVVLGSWTLARRCCGQPLLAAAVGCATPAFVVSATTLMADVPMLACWLWALVCWERGMRRGEALAFLSAAVLVALAVLTKFIALCLVPLLLGWSMLRELRPRMYMLWLLLPIVSLFGFEAYCVSLYGRGILTDAAGYASDVSTQFPIAERLVTALAFAGGTLLTTALYLPWLGSARTRVAALLAVPVLLGAVLALGQLGFTPIRLPEGGFRWDIALQVSVFAAAGLPVLALALAELRRPPGDAVGWMLALWVLGIFSFAALVNWTVSTRVILPMAPAAGILVARGLEGKQALTSGWRMAPVALGLAVSLLVARADFEWAGSARRAANDLASRYGERGHTQFQGHWGFQYYFEKSGATPFDLRSRRVVPGNTLIEPCNNSNVVPFPQSFGRFVETARYPSSRWLTVHSPAVGAGFYASTFGPLPWVLGSAPDELYDVLILQRPTGDPREKARRICGSDGASEEPPAEH